LEKYKAAMLEMKEKEDAEELAKIEDAMRDASIAFKGPSSYARQGCRTWHIDKRVEEMNRNWNRIVNNARSLGRGLSTHSVNPTV
jgi:methionine aminopeptidase